MEGIVTTVTRPIHGVSVFNYSIYLREVNGLSSEPS